MRLCHLIAAAVLAMTSCAFAVGNGYSVGAIGPTAHVTTSLNRSMDTYNAQPGFSGTRYDGGVGVAVHLEHTTNPTYSGSTNAQAQIMPIAGGKGYSTEATVPGRSDPMPIIAGKRTAPSMGGISE